MTGEFGSEQLTDWASRGEVLLHAARHDIDALNVFPVPDGDTGTNLLLTWQAASAALVAVVTREADLTLETDGVVPLADATAAWSRGALLGARGNSGVIVAQLLRGIAETFAGSAGPRDGALSAVEAGPVLATALRRAAELAYAGVARPVEGTILTVSAAAAAAAADQASVGLAAVARAAAEGAADALALTPEQLPVLAASGVVDAGGQGLVLILEALRAAVDPGASTPAAVLSSFGLGHTPAPEAGHQSAAVHAAQLLGDGDGAFEVMYLLDADSDAASQVRQRRDQIGASVVVVGGDGLWNVHVHTDDAGPAVEIGVAAGRVYRIRITPLRLQPLRPQPSRPQPTTAPADPNDAELGHGSRRLVVAVASGPALASLFKAVGAQVVGGGARKRPTPGALVAAAGQAEEVLLLPNDDDHRAAAEAAAVELRGRGAQVAVLPTHADVQGLAAMAVRDVERTFTEDVVAMSAAAAATRFGGLARAEREAMTSAGICRPGEILGLVEGDIVVLGDSAEVVACAVADRMLAAGGELVTLVCGEDPFPGRPLAESVRRHLHQTRLDVEVVVYDGGQSHYPLLMGVE
ncbi:MAG: DAK2 domain-containing protein [Actinomycetia bacterium]|nr:DAK2 domain-containing protein [Actinomycetes bacterium]